MYGTVAVDRPRLASPATPLGGTARAGGASKRGILAPVASARPADTRHGVAANQREDVNKALHHAQYRLQEGKDSLDMPDMANCVIS